MSYSVKTKNELARIISSKRCCQLAEFAAIIRMDGTVQISAEHKVSLTAMIENAAVARKVFKLAKDLFDIQAEIVVYRKNRLKKNNVYSVCVPPQPQVGEVLKALGLTDGHSWHPGFRDYFPTDIIKNHCCRRAYLRGVFLGGGSVNNPEGTYHLEILSNNKAHAQIICDLMQQFDLPAKISTRKNWYVVYIKESEQIIDFLNIIGAHNALLNFENIRIVKDMRNRVNRLVNCETANLNKTVNAAVQQRENIELIRDKIGLDKLSVALREIAYLRLEYPDVSLKELGEMLIPPLGKSGINHRMRKLEKIAEKLRDNTSKHKES